MQHVEQRLEFLLLGQNCRERRRPIGVLLTQVRRMQMDEELPREIELVVVLGAETEVKRLQPAAAEGQDLRRELEEIAAPPAASDGCALTFQAGGSAGRLDLELETAQHTTMDAAR